MKKFISVYDFEMDESANINMTILHSTNTKINISSIMRIEDIYTYYVLDEKDYCMVTDDIKGEFKLVTTYDGKQYVIGYDEIKYITETFCVNNEV